MVLAIITGVLLAFVVCLWIRVILSWFPISHGTVTAQLSRWTTVITDPVLRPVSRVLPPMRLGSGALDLSPLVVSIVLLVIIRLL
ncbi:MAG: YggT family protein [Acidimicrobiales bacterium]